MKQTHPMSLLASGVPLTLLLDLADAKRLPSRSILRREAGRATWLPTNRSGKGSSKAQRPVR